MEQEASVHLMEEEKNGWTIVSPLDNEKTAAIHESAEAKHEDTDTDTNLRSDPVSGKEEDEDRPADAGGGGDREDVQEGENESAQEGENEREGREDKVSKNTEKDEYDRSHPDDGDGDYEEEEEEEEEEEGADSDDDVEQDFLASKEATCSEDARKDFQWESHQELQEGTPLLGNEQTLAHQHVHKHGGLLWRVSLVATLGFVGWFVITGLGGGVGKNFRCLKFHPCHIKDGEAVLNQI